MSHDKNPNNLPSLEDFTVLCNNHDWTYEYSDDHSVWKRGSAQRDVLVAICKEGGAEYGHQLTKHHSMITLTVSFYVTVCLSKRNVRLAVNCLPSTREC